MRGLCACADLSGCTNNSTMCGSRQYPYSPQGIGISWGMGGSMRPKNLKKCIELNWNFQKGGKVAVYLYCYLIGFRCSWIIIPSTA